jgi:hypothetical protein
LLDYSNKLFEADRSVVTPEGRAAFARWAAAAATHFKDRGILWEIWNEPNHRMFWTPQPEVEQYAALALAASQAIRAAAPGEAIIGPATSTIDLKFLEGCFQAGLLQWWDAVSVHPYRQSEPETVEAEYGKLRRLIARYAPAGRTIPIVSGEWGYSSVWKKFDDDKQGRMLARQWLVNLANEVPLSIWYDWHDDGRDPREAEHHFGTVAFPYHSGRSPVYDPKPAYRAAQKLTTVLDGCRFVKRIDVGSSSDWVLLFDKGGQPRLAAWTTAQPHQIQIPLEGRDFRVVAHNGEPVASITMHDNMLTLTVSDAPLYLVP